MVVKHIMLPVLVLYFFLASFDYANCALPVLCKQIRLESKNIPNHYIRSLKDVLWLDDEDGTGEFLLDSTFNAVPGLSGVGVSLRSKHYYNHYIRHLGGSCIIDDVDGTPLFANDASWHQRPGLADSKGVSFESVNYPGYYVRHSHFRIYVKKYDGSKLFRNDATFYVKCTARC